MRRLLLQKGKKKPDLTTGQEDGWSLRQFKANTQKTNIC